MKSSINLSIQVREIKSIYAFLFFIVLTYNSSFANIFTVTSVNDSGAGSLRDLINNASIQGDSIYFDSNTDGVPILLSSPIIISKYLSIVGNGVGQTIISGNSMTRIFEINYNFSLGISNMSLIDGYSITGSGNNGGVGGAILSDGSLGISNCDFRNNIADYQGGAISTGNSLGIINSTFEHNRALRTLGGAIYSDYQFFGLENCTLDSNYARIGGGAIFHSGSSLNNGLLLNCTLSNNVSDSLGGALSESGYMDIINCTITSNYAAFNGGGIYSWTSTMRSWNSIIANNFSNGASKDGHFFNFGSLDPSSSNNIIGDSTGFGTLNTVLNLVNVDPQLGPLTNNGGIGYTHALMCNSSAINSADSSKAPLNDQRGISRLGSPDIGAYEFIDFNNTISVFGDTIVANQTGVQYQWYNCSIQNIVPGETSSTFITTSSGEYGVIINYNGCIDTSTCAFVSNVRIQNITDNNLITLFPNPVENILTIKTESTEDLQSISILNLAGQTIYFSHDARTGTNNINTNFLNEGLYILEMKFTNKIYRKKFTKAF